MVLSAEEKDGSWEPPFCVILQSFLRFRISFIASKITLTRNFTTSSGASGRSTEIQWSLFMWQAGQTPSAVPKEPNISTDSFRLTTSITTSLSIGRHNITKSVRHNLPYSIFDFLEKNDFEEIKVLDYKESYVEYCLRIDPANTSKAIDQVAF